MTNSLMVIMMIGHRIAAADWTDHGQQYAKMLGVAA